MHVFALQNHQCNHQMGAMDRYLILLAVNSSELRFIFSRFQDEPWPNLVVEVAYSESEEHVLKKVKDYWLGNLSRVHDAIVVKIDKVPPGGQIPLRMKVSYIYSLSIDFIVRLSF